MFTGIIDATGIVASLGQGRLVISADLGNDFVELGESIAINGCCLTATLPEHRNTGTPNAVLQFDLSPETLARTNLGDLKPGSIVNLERAMRADGRFGGHIVQGHVDA